MLTASEARERLVELWRAGVDAAAPAPAVSRELAGLPIGTASRPWIIAVGKAAAEMARGAVESLRARGAEPAGGVIVAPDDAAPPHPSLVVSRGEHPEPGAGSFAAAARIAEVAARARAGGEAWVLLSGGASSLAGATVVGVSPADFASLNSLLLGSGLDIARVNAVRKRFARWGAGRLAAALAPAHVRVLAISDVVGDEIAAIGSGPCAPDEHTAADVRRLLERAGLLPRVGASIREALSAAELEPSRETPKPGAEIFARVETRIVASNALALDAIEHRARSFGWRVVRHAEPLRGEAAAAGVSLAGELLRLAAAHASACVLAGGETVVTLGGAAAPRGGRCQELALAAARVLASATHPGASLLAAGTDGRDGPTDAAGAVVDGATWALVRRAGRDPAADLAAHRSHDALDAAGALLRTGLTGTNVMDVVIGVRHG
ncbi:MAG TPA: DUF4147 domain-containing protein [Gemmatimonadaceae bacterium]|nr:DUF4147 domain-containing protein [Gemmatimonadaceae bacterium]